MNSSSSNLRLIFSNKKSLKLSIFLLVYFSFNFVSLLAQCNNLLPANGNVGIQITTPNKLLHLFSSPACINPDVTLKLSYEGEDSFAGHLSLLHDGVGWEYTTLMHVPSLPATPFYKDLVLSADYKTRDIIITTRNSLGNIRFATTPLAPIGSFDWERMTITPIGKVGIGTNNPIGTFDVNLMTLSNGENQMPKISLANNGSYPQLRFYQQTGGPSQCTDPKNLISYNWYIESNNLDDQFGPWGTLNFRTGAPACPGTESNLATVLTLLNSGNVGINATNPSSRLEIKGTGNTSVTTAFKIQNSNNVNLFTIKDDGQVFAKGETFIEGKVHISDGTHISPIYQQQNHLDARLSVDGTIVAKEIFVVIDNWSDFVFNKDYTLPELSEVENHIKANGHLPGIPSDKEVKESGISLGELNSKLLQKIEELTLYLIELQKSNQDLTNRIQTLENK